VHVAGGRADGTGAPHRVVAGLHRRRLRAVLVPAAHQLQAEDRHAGAGAEPFRHVADGGIAVAQLS
jgi:hypothetical protein